MYSTKHNKIGEILIREGLISEVQLQKAVLVREESPAYKPIGQILVDQKAITQKQLNILLDRFKKRPYLGEILIRSGAISPENLKVALGYHKKEGIRLGEALIKLNLVDETAMRQALCIQLNIPFINLNTITINRSLAKLFSKSFAQKNMIVPISRIGDAMTIAMDDPCNEGLIYDLEAATGLSINVVTSSQEAIRSALNRLYEEPDDPGLDSELELIEEDVKSFGTSKSVESQKFRKADTIVGHIINLGLKCSASDIHLEASDRQMVTRFRIDGVLQETPLGRLQQEINEYRREIISRIKVIGKLDIAERRRPQDGSFRARMVKDGHDIKTDFRISIIPGYYGENVVLRILDTSKAPKSIDDLAFSERVSKGLRQMLERSTGIILITGPTGSGKSTTLYGVLMSLYRPGIKILTAEDPIEYIYDNITQCEVNQKIGNTFATYVRAFLRQDPEVIMVGEIRDAETAEMAFRAAQTGHLVLSTLHTNDAISSVTRLRDLNVDPNLISSCLLGVVAQRLVRKICPHCKKSYSPPQDLLNEFFKPLPSDMEWFIGEKCPECNYTGYSGRMAVAELWTPSEQDIILINKGAPFDQLRESSYKNTILMSKDAMEKVRTGQTNLEELIRTLPYSSIYQFRRPTRQGTLGLDPRSVSVIESHPAIPYLFVLGKPESVEIYKTAWGVVAFDQEDTYRIIGNEIGKELSDTRKEKLSEKLGSIIRGHAKTIGNADLFVDRFRHYYQKCNELWQEQGQEPPEEERAFLVRMIAEYLIKSIANNLQGKRGTKIKTHVYENSLRFIGYGKN